jgi:hypothetical protein
MARYYYSLETRLKRNNYSLIQDRTEIFYKNMKSGRTDTLYIFLR